MENTAMCDPSYETRKRIVLAGLFSIILVCFLWAAMPFTLAKELDDPSDESQWSDFHKTYETFKDSVGEELADGMFSSIDAIFDGSSDGNSINESLSTIRDTLEENSIAEDIARAMKGIAMFIVVLYSFIHMFAELQRGDGEMDMWLKCFVTVAVGLMVVLNWELIMNTLEQLGLYLAGLAGKAVARTDASNEIREWMDDTFNWGNQDMNDLSSYGVHVFKLINGIVENLVITVWAVVKMVGMFAVLVIFELPLLQARIVLLSILIEICIRKAFFPLAIADICGNGMRSPGVGYMKKFVALYLRVGMCYIIAGISTIVVNAVMSMPTDTVVEGFLRVVCVYAAYRTCVELYRSTSGIANQVMGQ